MSTEENMFRLVLEELIEAREKCGRLERDLHDRDQRIRDLAREKSLQLSDVSDHIAKDKEKIVALGSKLWLAATAASRLINQQSPEFLDLKNILHESANTFDEIPF